ncbi:MAG: hypothetical protein IPL97_09370 [Niastella sp.]|nr:hypothetical protein [Niastella sp.]
MWKLYVMILCLAGFPGIMMAQVKDSIAIEPSAKTIPLAKPDTAKPYNPKRAIIRSAILPGWGQVTNKKIWKVPIVYGLLGTTSALFFRNKKQYIESRDAYRLATDGDPSNDYLIKQPYYTVKDQPDRIRNFRNSVRQNMDYCVLYFLISWGVNVADAAVDAHLKTFDVSDDLSLHIIPGYSSLANTTGVSLVMKIGK